MCLARSTLQGHGGGAQPSSWVEELVGLAWLDASLEQLLQHARRSGSLVVFTSDREPRLSHRPIARLLRVCLLRDSEG